MAQADSQNSTIASVAPSRRSFLSQAAGVAAGGAVLALATTPPLSAATAPAAAAAIAEDTILTALGGRIDPALAAYRNAVARRREARAAAEANCPIIPQGLVCKGASWRGCAEQEVDVEGELVFPSRYVGEDGKTCIPGPRFILSSEHTKASIAHGNLYYDRRTRFGKQIAKQIEIAERYEMEREAAIERSGLLEARILTAYAEAELDMGHYRGRAGQLVGLALAQSITRLADEDAS
jgi:hypothetical protein